MSFEAGLFYAFAALAVFSALAMVGFVRNTVAAALSLTVTMVSLAGIYLLLEAHLVAVVQILVYAGAIVVLFLFVVMLLDLRHDAFLPMRAGAALVRVAGAVLAVGIFLLVLRQLPTDVESGPVPEGFGGYRVVGEALFTEYVVPLEVAGLVMLAAVVGAIVLAKRDAP